jgi:hypothetical protein
MLIVKVFVNHNQIDEIRLINTGYVKKGKHLYRFRKPEILSPVKIYHNRKENWSVLVRKALKVYENFVTKTEEFKNNEVHGK